MKEEAAVQDYYHDDVAHCYGCGRLNEHGYRLKTYCDGEETVTRYRPQPYHTAIPGYVYGGLVASLIDCHGTGTAAAASSNAAGLELIRESDASVRAPRFVTASLSVRYVRPTPLGPELEARGTVREMSDRKVVVDVVVSVGGEITARGEVIAVRMPENMLG